MNKYLKLDAWKIIEEGFNSANVRSSESLFSLGNGYMGQRANFEERYSGDTMAGNYIAGIYYPDRTKVGYWKVCYPEYFAKIANSANWIGIDIEIDGITLDLVQCKVSDFVRTLHMDQGYLERSFVAELKDGKKVKVNSQRFLSLVTKEIGAIKYAITLLNFSGAISITPFIDADVKNEDSNYGEKFWEDQIYTKTLLSEAYLTAQTRKTAFQVCTGMKFAIVQDFAELENSELQIVEEEKLVANKATINCQANKTVTVYKYAAVVTSENYAADKLAAVAKSLLANAYSRGFEVMLDEQKQAWAKKWEHSDIVIENDVSAQQAIRFSIYQLNQTYTGDDPRLNIGPKGFTGEKYGGVTYWDTEAYHFPFYLATAGSEVARNLLLYRYRHLDKAIETAKKMGFTNGAALFPMVTVNGEECHNEWEITFEEIHRNAAMVYAIYNYVRYTDDKAYLADYGLPVILAIARFWSQRVSFSAEKNKYVMLGVTGPNEYENNIDNNWYTTTMACWCMEYAMEVIDYVKKSEPKKFSDLVKKYALDETKETEKWREIIKNIYLPYSEKYEVFLQQEGYLDKVQQLAKDINPAERPINQHWSWDRILRSCFIKQADVLQGMYFLEEHFDQETLKRNFEFYEPRTVHESSLSPSIHAILAAKLGYHEKAYELYLRTARLDLDDYNNEVDGGCHIPAMSGTWLAIVQGFGGMRVKDGKLSFNPFIVGHWQYFAFKILFRENLLKIKVSKHETEITNNSAKPITVLVYGKEYNISGNSVIIASNNL